MKRILIVCLLCLALVLTACAKTEIRPVENGSESASEADILSFETTDLNGNVVSSAELFAANKLTMVNIWTTWCTYCIRELPDLDALNEELSARGCAVVGLLYDGNEGDAPETAKAQMLEAGADYPVLMPWDGMESDLPVQAFPTTIFVDSTGAIVGSPVVGADLQRYTQQIEALLAAEG